MNSASWSLLCYVNFASFRQMSFFLSVSPCGFVRTQYPWRSGLVLSTNKNVHTITDFVKLLSSFYLMIIYSEWVLGVRIMYVCHWSSADFVLCSFRSRPTSCPTAGEPSLHPTAFPFNLCYHVSCVSLAVFSTLCFARLCTNSLPP